MRIDRGGEVLPIFADTGHEHPITYEYLDYLESKLGRIKRIQADFSAQIERKRGVVLTKWRDEGVSEEIIQAALEVLHPTGNPFLDLCIWKGRFPSTKVRFCTQFLKWHPVFEQILFPLMDKGNHVVSWQGIRADESQERALKTEREDTPEGFEIYRPLLNWTVKDVFAIHDKYQIKPNPLYKMGMSRVGCMPCINSRKDELFEIALRFPEEIKRLAKWEKIVGQASKRGSSSFFKHDDVQGQGIYDVVEWSKTTYGGKNYDLIKAIELQNIPVCSSQYGLCE